MDFNAVLAGTLSRDATIRIQAEQYLSQAAESNFSEYLGTLGRELANDSAPADNRYAAGLALKNAFTAKESLRRRALQEKWLQQTDPSTKAGIKETTLRVLSSDDSMTGQVAAQVIAAIAEIELPREQWPELMPTLVTNVGEGASHVKQSSLTAIGFICESDDADLRAALVQHSNAILTAVVQGARKEEANDDVRNSAISALSDSLEFVKENFKNEGERNYIMQVICEATQSTDTRIQQGAFGCLNRIMSLYYEHMKFYMEKALFGLTIMGMRSEDEDVAKLAVEFWSTVCEEETSIEDDNSMAENDDQMRPYLNFSRVATNEVVPVLLGLLTKQDEDATEDEWNLARAAYACLNLYAQAVGGLIIQPVLHFVEQNLKAEDWHNRDAAVSAFGAIMEGPPPNVLEPIVKQALPVLIDMMKDNNVHVQDSTAYALAQICEFCSECVDADKHLPALIESLFVGLQGNTRMASSCCWAFMKLLEQCGGDSSTSSNSLTPHFNESVRRLLEVTHRSDVDSSLRTAAYQVLGEFVATAGNDSVEAIKSLLDVILTRLTETIPLQNQVVSSEDRTILEDMQISLCNLLLTIIQRLSTEVAPVGDRIMQILLQILIDAKPKSAVPDAVFAAIGGLAGSLDEGFATYMEAFSPHLFVALGNQEDSGLCAMAIGLVSDITRSLGAAAVPYCDTFMNYLLNNLRSTALSNQFKPAILECFGDIANAIGGSFEKYLSVVATVLQQAATIQAGANASSEMIDYITSLREGIMDAWAGIIAAMKESNQTQLLQSYVDSIFQLLNTVWLDPIRSENLMRASMGIIGDVADSFPKGDFAVFYRADWLTSMIKETRSNANYEAKTIETARWAREQVKRQISLPQ